MRGHRTQVGLILPVGRQDKHMWLIARQLPIKTGWWDALTQRAHHVESTLIRRRYYIDTLKTKFRRISTSFPHTFFDVISLVEKSMLFPRTFCGVILLVEKSTLFTRTFFDVILLVEKSTLFPCTFFNVISLIEIFTLFPLTFLGVILKDIDLTSFLANWKLMKTFEKVFLCL